MLFGPTTAQVATIVLAFYLLIQWVGDATIFWLPLYYEAKVLCVIMLWHPKVKGAAYVFNTYLAPMLRSHEASIDRNLGESKTRALDYVNGQVQRAKQFATVNSTGILEHVKSFSEQTASTSRHGVAPHRHNE